MEYNDGDIVWATWKNRWFLGEVHGKKRLPEGILDALRKPVIAFVKFFEEDTFEYVRNLNNICKYNCDKKLDLIREGLEKHNSKDKWMKKFPELVEHAETLTGGDPKIVATIQSEMMVSEKINNSIPVDEPEHVVVTNKVKTTPQSGRKPAVVKSAAKKSTAKTSSAIYRDSPSTSTQRRSNSVTSKFSCHLCSYSTDRMFLIMNHNKTHSNVEKRSEIISPVRIIPQTKLVLNDDDDEGAEDVIVTDVIGTSKKTQENAKKGKKTKVQPISSKKSPRNKKLMVKNEEVSSPSKQNSTELKQELLADWDDEDEDVEKRTNESKENSDGTGKVDSTVNLESSSKTVSPAKSESSPAKAIRNIPKKQRIDEFIMKTETKVVPEIEKKSIPEVPAVDIEKSPVKVASPKPKVSTVKNESPTKKIDDTCFDFQEDEPIDVKIPKSGKRKHVEEPEEPISKIKNNETKNDESLLLATENLLNETEVPLIAVDAAKSSSPTTFQKANDIDKRNLPPKERNKRIFKAKTQLDSPSVSVEKLEKKLNQNGGQNEVTPVKKTVAAIVSKTVNTPVESPVESPVAKEQRTPIVLPIKKSHSRNLNDFPRAMTSREMRSNDSNKSIQLEEPKTQKRKSLVQRNAPQPPPPTPTPAVEQQNTKKSGSESGFEDSDFSDYHKELDKKTRQTTKKPNVEVTPQNQASTSRDINISNSTPSKTRTPRKRLSEIDLFAAEEIFIVKRQRQRERERLGHEPEVSPKIETEKGSQKSVQKVAAKTKLEKTPSKNSSKVPTKVEAEVETEISSVKEDEKKNTHRRTYKRVASGLCITSKGQLVETTNTVISTTANSTSNVTVMSDVILSQAKMTTSFDNYASSSDDVPAKVTKLASSPIKNTKATDSPAKVSKIADNPSKVTKTADTPKQNTSNTLSSLSPRPKSSSSPQSKSNLNRTVLKIPSHKLEEFKRQGLVSTNNPNGRSVMTSKGLFEMATKMEKLIQKSDEDDAAIEDDSQNNKMDLGTKKDNESLQKVEVVTAALTAVINEEPASEIKSLEMPNEIKEEVMTLPTENTAITQNSPEPTRDEEECTEQQQQAEPVNGKLSEPEESEITEVINVQTKEQEESIVEEEKEEEEEPLKEEYEVVPQKIQPEQQETNGIEESDNNARDEQMPEVSQVEDEEPEIDLDQSTMIDENSQESESINAEMEAYNVSLPQPSPVEESNSENNNVSTEEPGYVALNADNFGGPPNCFFLCIRDNHGKYSPVNNELLVLDEGNALVPYQGEIPTIEENNETMIVENQTSIEALRLMFPHLLPDSSYEIYTTEGEKIVLNCQTILSILQAADNSGTAHVMIEDCSMELNVNEIMESMRLQHEAKIALMRETEASLIADDIVGGSSIALASPTLLDFPITTAQVSETWARPTIMSTVVSPETINVTKASGCETATTKSLNIDDSLATIGLGLKHNIAKSLELPLTITNPAIADTVNKSAKLVNAAVMGELTTDIVESFVVADINRPI